MSKSYWESIDTPRRVTINNKSKHQTKKVDNCHEYKDGWINIEYDISEIKDILDKVSPILTFYEGNLNNYDLLKNGVYNFILYWDDDLKKYLLSIAYFNAPEFGTKHLMLNTRLNGIVPNEFIFSGEFQKDSTDVIRFHDTSSFFFSNPKTFKKVMIQYYIKNEIIPKFQEIIAKDTDIKIIKQKLFEFLKENKIYPQGQTNANIKYKSKSIQEINDSIINGDFLKQNNKELEYQNELQNILFDAFERLFLTQFKLKFNKNLDYGNQLNIDKFIKLLCDQSPPIDFDVYENEDDCYNKEKKLKRSCDNKKKQKKKTKSKSKS